MKKKILILFYFLYNINAFAQGGCNPSVSQEISDFSPNPLFGYMQWSYDTLTLTNTGNCDVTVRPEFVIQHSDTTIKQNDIRIQWYSPVPPGFWSDIPYNIDNNGNAYGYWSFTSNTTNDSLGRTISLNSPPQSIPVRVRFHNANNSPPNGAPYGTYTAEWITYEVDNIGNIIQQLSPPDSVSLSLVDCNTFNVDESNSTNISCNGLNNGDASILSIENGSGNYSYLWSDGQATATATSLSAGSYTCTITDLSWSCSTTVSFSITEPDSITSNFTFTNATCYDTANGSAIVNFYGGTIGQDSGDVNYVLGWDTLTYNLPWPITQFTTPIGVPAGTYPYTATDINGCVHHDTIIISQPPALLDSVITNTVSCFGANDGSIIASASGGTAPYNFSYTDISGNPINPNLLAAGNYIVNISDNNNCLSANSPLNITINEPDEVQINLETNNISCNGLNDGLAEITPFGCDSCDIIWSNSITNTNINNNLPVGSYWVTITNIITTCSETEAFFITEPSAVNSNSITNNISCYGENDGSAIINIFGGTTGQNTADTNYILTWNNTDYILSVPTTSFSTANNLNAGTHIYNITDINGCTSIDSLVIIEPDSLYATYTLSNYSGYNVACFGGNNADMNIQIFGGSPNYEHYFNGILSNNNLLQNLSAGSFIDSIVDANGCSYTETININEPATSVNGILNSTRISCNGACDGSINIVANGGVAPYNYTWSNGITTNIIDSLCSGVYSVNIMDNNGCDTSISFILTEPLELTSLISADTITCHNDSAYSNILIWGGTSPYQYNWSNGDTNYFTYLHAGLYTVTITDINGCSLSDTVLLINPDSISIQSINTNATCFGLYDASINLNVISGGNSPYQYSIDNGLTSQNTNTFSNLSAGTYSCVITDVNGCLNDIQIQITQPDSLYSNISNTNASCYGECDAVATTNIYGGTAPYLEDWNGSNPNALCAGFHNVTITDAAGCMHNNSITVSQPNPIIINITQNGTSLQATSGLLNYQWYDNLGNPIASATSDIYYPMTEGFYFVEVTDSNGCSAASYPYEYVITNIEINNINNINIYPNPTNSKLFIKSSSSIRKIAIYSLLGKKVFEQKIDNMKRLNIIDLSDMCKGIYLIEIQVENEIINKRIILQ